MLHLSISIFKSQITVPALIGWNDFLLKDFCFVKFQIFGFGFFLMANITIDFFMFCQFLKYCSVIMIFSISANILLDKLYEMLHLKKYSLLKNDEAIFCPGIRFHFNAVFNIIHNNDISFTSSHVIVINTVPTLLLTPIRNWLQSLVIFVHSMKQSCIFIFSW